MAQALLPNELWSLIEAHLPVHRPSPKGGRPRIDDRAALTGILFVLKTGIPREYLPRELGCGSGMSCWRRLHEWMQAGVWQRVHEAILRRLRDTIRSSGIERALTPPACHRHSVRHRGESHGRVFRCRSILRHRHVAAEPDCSYASGSERSQYLILTRHRRKTVTRRIERAPETYNKGGCLGVRTDRCATETSKPGRGRVSPPTRTFPPARYPRPHPLPHATLSPATFTHAVHRVGTGAHPTMLFRFEFVSPLTCECRQ
jgi:transposase